MRKTVDVLFAGGSHRGSIELSHGVLAGLEVVGGSFSRNNYELNGAEGRVRLTCDEVRIEPGARATVVYVRDEQTPFCFFLRDVASEQPLYVAAYGVVVTAAEDERDFETIRGHIAARGARSKLERYADEPQESFAAAAAETRNMKCPI